MSPSVSSGGGRWCGGGLGVIRLRPWLAALGGDELGQPAHLALGGVEAVPLELGGVGVEAFAVLGRSRADVGEALLQPAPATLEDAQAHLGLGAREEGEVPVERVVLPRRRARLAHQGLEPLLALSGELVDDPRPAAADAAGAGGRWGLDDPALLEQAAQAGVERAVGKGPEGAERRVEPLAQLVAV